jgi:hypothetical protein
LNNFYTGIIDAKNMKGDVNVKTLLTCLVAFIIAVACFGFTGHPTDVGDKHSAQASVVSASDTAVSNVPADLDQVVIVKAARVEHAVAVPSEPVPATLFARQRFIDKESEYQSRTLDVEVPPNITPPKPETSRHRGREDV